MIVVHYEAGKSLFGGAYQVVGLLERLQAGAEHHLLCAQGSAIAEHAAPFAKVHSIPIAGDTDPRPFFHLRRLLRTLRPDLLHIHSRRGADLWGPLAARRARLPFIVSRRVDNREPAPMMRWKLRGASQIVGISERICEVLRQMGLPPERIRCIRSGVDLRRYQPRLRSGRLHAEFNLPSDAPLIGMVAQFIPRKGHADLVAAARSILARHPFAVFLLFGKGSLREEIEQQVNRAGVAPAFRFPGFRDDLPELLPELDLLVHPAHMEGLGVAVLQAMACGLPVVAGNAGGLPEIVRSGENGYLVPPGDPGILAERINELLADPIERQTMGAQARDFVVRACSLEATAAANGALYLETLRAARSA